MGEPKAKAKAKAKAWVLGFVLDTVLGYVVCVVAGDLLCSEEAEGKRAAEIRKTGKLLLSAFRCQLLAISSFQAVSVPPFGWVTGTTLRSFKACSA